MRRALVLAVLVGTAGEARAEDAATLLARARSEVEGLRYDVAQGTLARALETGGADREQLIAIYRLSGEVAGALDQEAQAKEFFARLLALQPDARLDAGVSPKIAGPFAAARKAARGRLQAHDASSGNQVVIEAVTDPLGMVARARVYIQPNSGVADTRILDGQSRWELALPEGTRSWSVTLLDTHGNQLLVMRGEVVAAVVAPPRTDSGGRRAWYARWYPWAGLAVGLGATGTAMGLWANSIEQDLDELNRNSLTHEFAEAQALERKGRRVTLASNLCFAGAGAAAVVGAIFLIRGDRRSATEVAATPVTGGAVLVYATPF